MDTSRCTTAYRTEIWRCIKREAGGAIFKSWGYTPQKPIRKAFEQKPEQVKQWLEKEYPHKEAGN